MPLSNKLVAASPCTFSILNMDIADYCHCPCVQASDETDSRGPRGFFQPVLGGYHSLKDYPTLITTQMSSHRARDALTYLQVCPYACHTSGAYLLTPACISGTCTQTVKCCIADLWEQGCATHVDVMMLCNPQFQTGWLQNVLLLCMIMIFCNLTRQRMKDAVCCAGWTVHRR